MFITSDKCYDNVEWEWGYRETDRLGGKDPYSASKGGAELVIRTFFRVVAARLSRFGSASPGPVTSSAAVTGRPTGWCRTVSAPGPGRDSVDHQQAGSHSPLATRAGAAERLPGAGNGAGGFSGKPSGRSVQLRPDGEKRLFSVAELIRAMQVRWDHVRWEAASAADAAGSTRPALLKLNCDKALHHLAWRPTYGFEETVNATMAWYQSYYGGQIGYAGFQPGADYADYRETARSRQLAWAL